MSDELNDLPFDPADVVLQPYEEMTREELIDCCKAHDAHHQWHHDREQADSEALRKVREALAQCIDNLAGSGYFLDEYKEALSELDRMLGGG